MVLRKSTTHLRHLICFPLFVFGLLLMASSAQSDVVDFQRVALQDGIAHYTFDVDLGPDEFDTVRLHRIVKEKHEGKPVATIDGIFMLPGAPNFFEMIFLPSVVSAPKSGALLPMRSAIPDPPCFFPVPRKLQG